LCFKGIKVFPSMHHQTCSSSEQTLVAAETGLKF